MIKSKYSQGGFHDGEHSDGGGGGGGGGPGSSLYSQRHGRRRRHLDSHARRRLQLRHSLSSKRTAGAPEETNTPSEDTDDLGSISSASFSGPVPRNDGGTVYAPSPDFLGSGHISGRGGGRGGGRSPVATVPPGGRVVFDVRLHG